MSGQPAIDPAARAAGAPKSSRRVRTVAAVAGLLSLVVCGAVAQASTEPGAGADEGGLSKAAAAAPTSTVAARKTPVPPDDLGDDPDLDSLAQSCFDGDLVACDQLYLQSPADSAYETYGDTCAGRQEAGHGSVLRCRGQCRPDGAVERRARAAGRPGDDAALDAPRSPVTTATWRRATSCTAAPTQDPPTRSTATRAPAARPRTPVATARRWRIRFRARVRSRPPPQVRRPPPPQARDHSGRSDDHLGRRLDHRGRRLDDRGGDDGADRVDPAGRTRRRPRAHARADRPGRRPDPRCPRPVLLRRRPLPPATTCIPGADPGTPYRSYGDTCAGRQPEGTGTWCVDAFAAGAAPSVTETVPPTSGVPESSTTSTTAAPPPPITTSPPTATTTPPVPTSRSADLDARRGPAADAGADGARHRPRPRRPRPVVLRRRRWRRATTCGATPNRTAPTPTSATPAPAGSRRTPGRGASTPSRPARRRLRPRHRSRRTRSRRRCPGRRPTPGATTATRRNPRPDAAAHGPRRRSGVRRPGPVVLRRRHAGVRRPVRSRPDRIGVPGLRRHVRRPPGAGHVQLLPRRVSDNPARLTVRADGAAPTRGGGTAVAWTRDRDPRGRPRVVDARHPTVCSSSAFPWAPVTQPSRTPQHSVWGLDRRTRLGRPR